MGEWRDGRLAPGPFHPDQAGSGDIVHHTGDVAIRYPDGLYAVLGRKHRQIKIHGNRIEPAEIDETLRGLAGVAQAAVAARKREEEPELLAFIVSTESDTNGNRRSVIREARHALPAFMFPSRFNFLRAMPLLPGGS